jgi:ribosome maturation factor RimP
MPIDSTSRTETTRQRLLDLVHPVVNGLGLQLWGMEYLPMGRKALIRIYIESPEGVSIDHCATVSRQLGPALEMEETLRGSFTLEVSSPGLERRFFQPEQLTAYLDQTVNARLLEPLNGCKHFQGRLTNIQGETITLRVAEDEIVLQWDHIKKIHLVHEF